MNGNINEYVFDKSRTETNNHLSELDWDVLNIPYAEIGINLVPAKYFFFDYRAKFGFPKTSGHMQDYDWLNGTSSGLNSWINDDIGELTNYSIHTNKLESYVDCSLVLGGRILLPKDIVAMPFVDFSVFDLYLSGYDGYGIYKSKGWQKSPFEGNVISYNVVSKAVYFGLNVNVNTFNSFDIKLGAAVSPNLCWTDAYDIHVLRNTTFHDKIYKSLAVKGNASVYYRFNEMHSAGIEAEVKYHPEGYGSYKRINNGQGGISYFLYDISLNYIFSL